MDTTTERVMRDPEPPRSGAPAPAASSEGAKPKGKGRLKVMGSVAAIALGAVAIAYWLHAQHFEETDDAQIDGEISGIGTRVVGVVKAVYVKEDQTVKAGDLLLELDPADLEVFVAQARAQVHQAEAQLKAEDPSVDVTETSNTASVASAGSDVSSAVANLGGAKQQIAQLAAQVEQARASDRQAQLDRERDEHLFQTNAISRAEYDRATSVAAASAAGVRALEGGLQAARDRLGEAQARLAAAGTRLAELRSNSPRQLDMQRASVLVRRASLDLARAGLRQAELNLSYTGVTAPIDGIIGKKAVSVGDHVAPGQELVAIVQIGHPWVTANFRETQLKNIRPGQPVAVHVDAVDLNLHGTVEAIGGATGSRLSVLPPENASGNYVKVVQRIPVRIRLDPGEAGLDRIRPGMSVEPQVKVR